MLGTAIGPSSVGFITDYILGDEQKVGMAIAGSTMLFCAGAALSFALGLGAARHAISESEKSLAKVT